MATHETPRERNKRFKEMSSQERKALIRQKMKAEGLSEGSGVAGKDLSSYDRNEIWDLIQLTRCFPELQRKETSKRSKRNYNKKSLFMILIFLLAILGVIVTYYKEYPYQEIRRELSIDGIFLD